ncbi:MAG: AAA family ATPase [Chloroflexia bacterium]|nr:AAA family ATPase [Chloroflexia bacterium]
MKTGDAPPTDWGAEGPQGWVQARSLATVSRGLVADVEGAGARLHPVPTGFSAIDRWISGGVRAGDLVLLGGAQGVGKTTMCLQMARNIAASGQANVLYACYEHPDDYVLNRLLVQETIDPTAAGVAGVVGGLTLDELVALMAERNEQVSGKTPLEAVGDHPAGARAIEAVNAYAERFHLVTGVAHRDSIGSLKALVSQHRMRDNQPLVLFVDYLQKVQPARQDLPDEAERVTEVVQELKQLALGANIAVVAIVAAEKEGLRAPRLRFTHLRGSSALMYEADIAIIMNDKWQIIDRDRIVFNIHKSKQYRDWIVCTIEKNRSGRNLVDVEFLKRFEHCCFNPNGEIVAERLYEERIQGERE